MTIRHFLNTQDWTRDELDQLLVQAAALIEAALDRVIAVPGQRTRDNHRCARPVLAGE